MPTSDQVSAPTVLQFENEELPVSEAERLGSELQLAQTNLKRLSEGVRVLTIQLMNKHKQTQGNPPPRKNDEADDNDTHATAEITLEDGISASGSFADDAATGASSEGGCLSTEHLAPLPAIADLLALHNVTEMVQEHARLTSIEAATAVNDAIQAQHAARYWQKRAQAAEADLAPVEAEASRYKALNQKLLAERKVLVKEVRKCRKELVEKERESVWTQLETYVNSALNIHEHQLKTPKATAPALTPTNSECREEEGDEGPTQLEIRTTESETVRPRLPSIGFHFPFGDSASKPSQPSSTASNHQKETPRSRNTTVRMETETPPPLSPSRNEESEISIIHQNESFGSPITFLESPPGAQPAKYGDDTVADPSVLRSLALPSPGEK